MRTTPITTLYLDQVQTLVAKALGQHFDSKVVEMIMSYVIKLGGSPYAICMREVCVAEALKNKLFQDFESDTFYTIVNTHLNKAKSAQQIIRKCERYLALADDRTIGTSAMIAETADFVENVARERPDLATQCFSTEGVQGVIEQLKTDQSPIQAISKQITPMLQYFIKMWLKDNHPSNPDYEAYKLFEGLEDYTYEQWLDGLKGAYKLMPKYAMKALLKPVLEDNIFEAAKRRGQKAPQPYNPTKRDINRDFRYYTAIAVKSCSFSITGFWDNLGHNPRLDGFSRRTETVQSLATDFNVQFSIKNKKLTKDWLQKYLDANQIKYKKSATRKELFKKCMSF